MVNLNKVLKIHEKDTGVLSMQAGIRIRSKYDLAEAYTPGIGALAKLIETDESAKNKYTLSGKLVALVTDGTAVLGLGNIGPAGGLPIVEGKALIYKRFSDVDALPLAINQVPIVEFVETITNIAKSFAGIHLEDIAAPRCFEIEAKLKAVLDIPVYHDDQTGTAIVVLAALMNAARVVDKPITKLKVLIHGVGASGLATAKLLYRFGITQLTLVDIHGKITENDARYNHYQRQFSAIIHQGQGQSLDELISGQDVFIGLSDGDVLSVQQVSRMADDCIVFALANPCPEIAPDLAKAAGVKIMATGSSQYPNQVNNLLVFPGLFKGLLETHLKTVDEGLQIKVAQALSNLTVKPEVDNLIADVFDEGVVATVVSAVKAYASDK